MPAAPGLCQTRPKTPQQQVPTPGRQEVMQATPYQQQVFLPKCPAPKPSTTPSASQDHGDPAGEAGGARGRSSSRGPQDRQGRSQSSTRGSRKRRWADPTDSLADKMANFVASRVETRSHPFHRLLLGGPDRFPGTGRVARGHHQIPRSNGEEEKSLVDGYKGVDTTPVYALRGKTI